MHAEPTFGDDSEGAVTRRTDIEADLYANHLVLAEYLRSWAGRMVPGGPRAPRDEDDYLLGYARALTDLATHLVEGDGLPGGPTDLTLHA